MSISDPLSVNLARWASSLRYEDLPRSVVNHVKRSLLDYLGVTIRGSASKISRTLQTHLSKEGCGRASVIGTSHMLSPANATLANGVAAAVLELDDGHARAPIHMGAICIPAILSIAQYQGANARDVILATAIAFEVSSRLAIGANAASEQGFNTTSLVGIFGAAIGVAKILGSSADTISNALGIAGSNTGGLFDYHGGWLDTWALNVGKTGREGLMCAILAEQGIRGPVDIFDGPRGFAAMFTRGRFDRNAILNALGQEWSMLDTYVKIYPCCRKLHSPIDAALSLRTNIAGEIDAIERIVVETSAESARLDNKTFDGTSEAQMSIPYGVAAAFVFGPLTLKHFDEAARLDPRVLRLIDLVEVRKSDDLTIANCRSAARLNVSILGNTFSVTVEEPSGNPRNRVSEITLMEKFYNLADPVIGREASARLCEAVWGLDDESNTLRFIEQLALLSCPGSAPMAQT